MKAKKLAVTVAVFSGAMLLMSSGCNGEKGDAGATGATGPAGTAGAGGTSGTTPTNTVLNPYESLPGLTVTVTALAGGTGTNGNFKGGDSFSFTFTIKKDNGVALPISELNGFQYFVSGPTSNYNRVIPKSSGVTTGAVQNSDGSYTYTVTGGLPTTYTTPPNYTGAFTDGVLTGNLQDGTYTLGWRAWKDYYVNGEKIRDVSNDTKDFLVGNATTIEKREVVTTANCNRCHVKIQRHSGEEDTTSETGRARDARTCGMCHTAGAEDWNETPDKTPNTTVEYKVMVHKIHNAAHLPSVLGVSTKVDGTRDYAVAPKAYEIENDELEVFNFSGYAFPIMPSAEFVPLFDADGVTYKSPAGNGPMPRDVGYSALTKPQKLLEDRIRSGAVACDKCHGDNGAGAPAQGTLAYTQPSRRACGSCHDDVIFTQQYVSNGQTMPAQSNDSSCVLCHTQSGTALSVQTAHTHPYSDTTFNTGVVPTITAIGGGTGGGGNHQAGDPVLVTFNVKNTAGTNINIHNLARFQWAGSGPTSNIQQMIPAINLFDVAEPTKTQFRTSSPFSGNGTMGAATVGATAIQQVLAIVFTGSNVFDVVGSVSGNLATGLVVPDGGGNTGDLTYAGVTFKITDGATNFAAGDRYYLEVYPTADSYSVYIPRDISRELLGTVVTGTDVFTVGNIPLYWGRQVVYERTAFQAGSVTTSASAAYGRYVTVDSGLLAGVAVGDIVVLDDGLATEEYASVGRIQTTDDVTGTDFGNLDRIWFDTDLRYAHANGATVNEVTLTSKREGVAYNVTDAVSGKITLLAGQFTNGNRVVANYRTYARFGWRRAPADALQAVYPGCKFDSDDFDITWGDWKGKSIVDGTYTVGMWASVDFAITPLRVATTAVYWSNINTDNTPYQMMGSATRSFLYGTATTVTARSLISSGDNCNTCHGDLAGHGMRRRGFDVCILCHGASGEEDKAKYATNGWYVGATPNVTIDFRVLIHKAHMGEELANAETYNVVGDVRGTPFNANYGEVLYPTMPGRAKHCDKCHGSTNTAWKEPADRDHPTGQTAPLRKWRSVCTSCHDDDDTSAHVAINTSNGEESCGVCHGTGKEFAVEIMHKNR